MSDHIPDATKMISDTPRTDEQINGKPCTRFEILAGDSLRNAAVPSEFARTIERELNAANEMFRKLNLHTLNLTDRIKRLEEAGDELICYLRHRIKTHDSDAVFHGASITWGKVKKEAKP